MLSAGHRFGGMAGVLIAAVLWRTTGTAATFAPDLSPVAVGAVAMGIGGILQGVITAATIIRQRRLISRHWQFLLTGAVAVAVYPLAFYASMRYAGVTVGTVISIGSAPLLSALIEYRFDGVRLTKQWMCGAAVGIAGMVLLCLAGSSGNSTENDHTLAGIFLGLLAGFTYAFYSWSARRLMQSGVASRAAMGATFGAGGILLMPVLFMTGAPLLAGWNNAVVGMYMALIPMFVGYVCYGYGLARIPASMATTITFLEPVIAALLAVLLVGERLPLSGWAGAGLIIACLGIITVPASGIPFRLARRRADNLQRGQFGYRELLYGKPVQKTGLPNGRDFPWICTWLNIVQSWGKHSPEGFVMTITTVGIDLAKNVFAVHCVDQNGRTVLVKPKVSRAALPELIAGLPPCVIGMEACSGAQTVPAVWS